MVTFSITVTIAVRFAVSQSCASRNSRVGLQGLLSDGLVAWRFYIIYERRRWALYVPTIFVILNASACHTSYPVNNTNSDSL